MHHPHTFLCTGSVIREVMKLHIHIVQKYYPSAQFCYMTKDCRSDMIIYCIWLGQLDKERECHGDNYGQLPLWRSAFQCNYATQCKYNDMLFLCDLCVTVAQCVSGPNADHGWIQFLPLSYSHTTEVPSNTAKVTLRSEYMRWSYI